MMRRPEVQSFITTQLMGGPGAFGGTPPTQRPDADLARGSLPYYLGVKTPSLMAHPFLRPIGNWASRLGVDTPGAATTGALLGGLAGAGWGVMNRGRTLQGAMTGAAGGALGSAFLSELVRYLNQPQFPAGNVKRAYYGDSGQPDIQIIQSKLFGDSNLDGANKARLMDLISGLPPGQVRNLASLVQGAFGAGIGFLIARFLLGLGVGGTFLLTLAGGALGAHSGAPPKNVYGDSVDPQFDLFGRRRLI